MQEIVDAAEVFFHSAAAEFVHFGDESVQKIAVVADADQCPVEVLQGGFEHVFGLHVQMVGGLIEYEQVARLQQESYHRQTASFASGEDFHFLVGSLSAEHECAEDVADFCPYITHRHVINGLKDREVPVQQRRLVLGEISDLDVVSDLERAHVIQLTHDTFDECGFTFAVLADKGYFFASADGKSNIMKDIMGTEIFAQVFYYQGKIAAPRGRRKTQIEFAGVLHIHLQPLQFLQLFDAALHLYRFGGFVSEPLDKILCVGDHFLLVLVGAYLLLMPFLAQLHKAAVVDVVIIDASERNLNCPSAHVVNKRAVVADHEHR